MFAAHRASIELVVMIQQKPCRKADTIRHFDFSIDIILRDVRHVQCSRPTLVSI